MELILRHISTFIYKYLGFLGFFAFLLTLRWLDQALESECLLQVLWVGIPLVRNSAVATSSACLSYWAVAKDWSDVAGLWSQMVWTSAA